MERELKPGYSRRDFLRGSLMGAGALAFTSYAADKKDNPKGGNKAKKNDRPPVPGA